MVDGIDPVSTNMLGTLDLELSTKGLVWKNVTKGYRSKTRRSKKMVNDKSLTAGVKINNEIYKSEYDSSVLESEKFGVAILGRRFANQVEHVPIRKGRFLLRSPSPPPLYEESLSAQPQTPPQSVEPEQFLFCKLGSNECNSPVSYSNLELANGEISYPEDMSGIELLVAAACGTISSPDNVKDSSAVEEFVAVEGNNLLSGPLKENIAMPAEEVKEPSKVEKFSWDLNVVMECDEPDDTFVSHVKDSEVVIEKSSEVFSGKDPSIDIPTFVSGGESCSRTSAAPPEESSVEVIQIEDSDVVSPKNISQGNDVCEIDIIQSKDGDDLGNTHNLENSSGNLDKVDDISHDEFSASSTSIVDVHSIAISFVKEHDDKAFANTAISDIPVHREPNELIPKSDEHLGGGTMSQGLCSFFHENPNNSICILSSENGSDVGGVESVTDYQMGYESPFEDGELRDSTNYSWDANDVDEGGNECVDFESGNVSDFDDAVDYPHPENFGVGCEGGHIDGSGSSLGGNKDNELEFGVVTKKGMLAAGQIVKEDALKEQSSSALKSSQENRLLKCSPDRSYKLGGDSYDQLMKLRSYTSSGREKSIQVHSRNEGGGRWFESSTVGYAVTRNRLNTNSYYGNARSYSRPRGLITDSASKNYELNLYDERKSMNYSSKGMCRPFTKRRSPPPPPHRDRYPISRELPAVRAISRDSSRGRPGIYHDDLSAPSVRMPLFLSTRERDFSPNFTGAKFSQPRIRPRARTRSPIFWNFKSNREQHSPDFKSESKIDGSRLPIQNPRSFDYEDNLVIPSRGRSPPQRNNTRWFDERKGMDDDFRGGRSSPPRGRSPFRMLKRPQRHFDSDRIYSSRHMVDEAKSPQLGMGRRRHDDGYEPINRMKRYDESVYVRRIRYDGEYSLKARNAQNEENRGGFRGTLRRKDAPVSYREERSARYNSDRVYANAPLVHEPVNYKKDASTVVAASLPRGE